MYFNIKLNHEHHSWCYIFKYILCNKYNNFDYSDRLDLIKILISEYGLDSWLLNKNNCSSFDLIDHTE